jgi:hypothetical protein
MEIVIMLFVLVGGSLAFSAWKKNKTSASSPSVEKHDLLDQGSCIRKCLACGFKGEMKTWIANYNAPKIITVIGFLLGYVPGLIFLAIYWGKYKCPSCESIGKNQQITDEP